MMTSSNGNIFRIIGILWWIPPTNASYAAFYVSLICFWINGWRNNGEDGDNRRHRANYNVTIMHVKIYLRGYSWDAPTTLGNHNGCPDTNWRQTICSNHADSPTIKWYPSGTCIILRNTRVALLERSREFGNQLVLCNWRVCLLAMIT